MAIPLLLLIPLIVIATGIAYLALQQAADAWLKPLLQWIFAPRQSFWKRALGWVVSGIGKGLAAVLKYIKRILGGAFFLAGAALAHFFHAYAWVTELEALALERLAGTVFSAFNYMRTVAIPLLVEIGVAPVRLTAQTAYNIAVDHGKLFNNISIAFMVGLRALPWGAPIGLVPRVAAFWDSYAHIWDQVFKHIVPQIRHLTTVVIPGLVGRVDDIWRDLYRTGRNSLPGVRTRLADLERGLSGILSNPLAWLAALLTSVAGIALLTQVLARVAPNLFCRNTKKALDPLCKMRFADFDDLFAFFVQVAIISNFRQYVRLMQGVTGTTATGIKTLLDVR